MKILNWIKDNLLTTLIASFLIPAILGFYNQQSEITKTVFEVDYKEAKQKYIECDQVHRDYISAVGASAGAALLLQQNFGVDDAMKYGGSNVYFAAFRGAMETFQKSMDQQQDLLKKTSVCYANLTSSYENVAIALNLTDEFHAISNQGAERIDPLIKQREAIRADFEKRVDMLGMYRALATSDTNSAVAMYKQANFGDLSTLQIKTAEMEAALETVQHEHFVALNDMFANEFHRRLHSGLLRSFVLMLRV
jgi:hypothetical protein